MLTSIFMGTPDFAVPSLLALNGASKVLAAVTQPDKPRGRGNKLSFPAVKEAALGLGVPVLQPDRIRSRAFLSELEALSPDIIVVAAYGRILPESILKLPKHGCINVHGSLLPKYRGASPIQAALLNGDTVAGATIMRMDKGLDTGDIIHAKSFDILPDDTGGSVFDKMAAIGAEALIEAIYDIETGAAAYIKQDEALASYCGVISKDMARIDWNKSSKDILNMIRAYNPWPCAFTTDGKGSALKIWKAEDAGADYALEPGSVAVVLRDKGIIVKTGDGAVIITELQYGSGKRMSAADYLRGHNVDIDRFV